MVRSAAVIDSSLLSELWTLGVVTVSGAPEYYEHYLSLSEDTNEALMTVYALAPYYKVYVEIIDQKIKGIYVYEKC